MTTISVFFGIIIRMYKDLSGKYNIPHIHVTYSNEAAIISLDGEILEGAISRDKLKLVNDWIDIHYEDLATNWNLFSEYSLINNLPKIFVTDIPMSTTSNIFSN